MFFSVNAGVAHTCCNSAIEAVSIMNNANNILLKIYPFVM